MVFKVNNMIVPFSTIGGSKKRKTRVNRSKKRKTHVNRKQKGGFISALSPVFNWSNKCPNTGKLFKIET